MMLLTVLLLNALLISDVAGFDFDFDTRSGTLENGQLETETDQDQNLEKREVLGSGYCFDGRFYFGYCYQFVPQKKTWIEAELHCQKLAPGGHLASIHSQEQNEFIGRVIHAKDASDPYTWLGLNDIYQEGAFLWTDGSASDFTKWSKAEPNNASGKEDCVHFNFPSRDVWNDKDCNEQYPFICSYKLD